MAKTESNPDRRERGDEPAPDWNVVATLAENSFRQGRRILSRWGRVRRTPHYNVLAVTADDPAAFLQEFAAAVREAPGILNFVAHVMPAQASFDFATADEFNASVGATMLRWRDGLAGKTCHVRMHRRGLSEALPVPEEERRLGKVLLDAVAQTGNPAHIGFEDPDAVLQIETIDHRAGVSLWTREDLRRYPFLGPL